MNIDVIKAQFEVGDLVTVYYEDMDSKINTFQCKIIEIEGICVVVSPYVPPTASTMISELSNLTVPLLASFVLDIR